jgi:hypothetical protein
LQAHVGAPLNAASDRLDKQVVEFKKFVDMVEPSDGRDGHPDRRPLRSLVTGFESGLRDDATPASYKPPDSIGFHIVAAGTCWLRLREPNGVRDEFHLAAAAQNLRKPAKLILMPTPRPA